LVQGYHGGVTLRLLFFLFVLSLSTCTAQPSGDTPGVFDYYVLSLSWSPQYCASNGGRTDAQCGGGREYGFVLHGLWPQFERGFPGDCGTASLSNQIVDRMLPIMPSAALIRHEWRKHGTCSGLEASQYFAKATAAFRGFVIPTGLKAPLKTIYISPRKLKQDLAAANPRLGERGIAVLCNGRYLQEVRACYTKDLQPRECGSGIRDTCRVDELIVRPVR